MLLGDGDWFRRMGCPRMTIMHIDGQLMSQNLVDANGLFENLLLYVAW
jgi:hypothetical protein